MSGRVADACAVLFGRARIGTVERVEVLVPITRATIYGSRFPGLPYFKTADACIDRYREAHAYLAFECEGKWYATGACLRLVELKVID